MANKISGVIESAKRHLDGQIEIAFRGAAGQEQQVFLPDNRSLAERFYKGATDDFKPGAAIELTTDGEPDRPTVVAVAVAGKQVFAAPGQR